MRSGDAVPCVITFDHAAMPWSMNGRQKACGSAVCPWPSIWSQAWPASAHRQLALDELVLLVEVLDPVPKELTRERQVLVRPLVQRVETGDVLRIPEVPPQIEVGGQVHRRLEELEAELHHVGRDAAQ